MAANREPNQPERDHIEVMVAGATLFLSTAAYLFASPALAVVALVIGGISFGIVLGPRGGAD